jgi:hypothetical protein
MNNKFGILALAFLVTVILSSSVYAWGPNTHMYINEKVLEAPELENSPIVAIIKQNEACFSAGFQATDISIIYYYTEGKKYEATHSWRFQKAMLASATNDCERAFAYGIAAHLIQDSVAHNTFVPDKIRQTLIQNNIIHPVEEGKIEAWVIKNNPGIFEKNKHSLDRLLEDPQLIDKMQDQIYFSVGIIVDVERDAQTMSDAFGSPDGFYTQLFKLPDVYKDFSEGNVVMGAVFFIIAVGLIFLSLFKLRVRENIILRIFGYLLLLISIIILIIAVLLLTGGITGWVNIADAEEYIDASIERTVYLFQPANWEKRVTYDPTGFDALARADSDIGIWFYMGMGLIVFIIMFGGWLYVRRK